MNALLNVVIVAPSTARGGRAYVSQVWENSLCRERGCTVFGACWPQVPGRVGVPQSASG